MLHCPYQLTRSIWTDPENDFIIISGTITPTKKHRYIIESDSGHSHTLLLRNFTETDQGHYRCQIPMNGSLSSHNIFLRLCRKFKFTSMSGTNH